MEFRQLRYFVKVAQLRSFSEATKILWPSNWTTLTLKWKDRFIFSKAAIAKTRQRNS